MQVACVRCRLLQTFSSESETLCMRREPVVCHRQDAAQAMSVLSLSEVPYCRHETRRFFVFCLHNAYALRRIAYDLEVHPLNALADLSAPNNRPITDCLFQDASSSSKSHIVTIVKSQWYDRRLVTLLP